MKSYMNNLLVTLVLGLMLTSSVETFAAGIHEIALFDGLTRRTVSTSPTQFDTHAAAVRHVVLGLLIRFVLLNHQKAQHNLTPMLQR